MMVERLMKWKEFGRRRLRSNLRYYPNIFIEGLRKPTKKKNLSIVSIPAEIRTGYLRIQARRDSACATLLSSVYKASSVLCLWIAFSLIMLTNDSLEIDHKRCYTC